MSRFSRKKEGRKEEGAIDGDAASMSDLNNIGDFSCRQQNRFPAAAAAAAVPAGSNGI